MPLACHVHVQRCPYEALGGHGRCCSLGWALKLDVRDLGGDLDTALLARVSTLAVGVKKMVSRPPWWERCSSASQLNLVGIWLKGLMLVSSLLLILMRCSDPASNVWSRFRELQRYLACRPGEVIVDVRSS